MLLAGIIVGLMAFNQIELTYFGKEAITIVLAGMLIVAVLKGAMDL